MKYVIVTGAYGGMGRATVKELVSKGYTVFALDKMVVESENNVISIATDLTDVNCIKEAFKTIRSVTDSVDSIIHFAGIYMLNSLVEISDDDIDCIFRTNFFGAFHLIKIFLPLLKKGGKIIMTTSELAPLDPLPFTGVYAITKSTLDKYAYSFRMELQLLGIYVSVIRAGAVATGLLKDSTDALDKFCENTVNYQCNAERFKKIVNGVESKNIPAEEIAKKVIKILKKKRPKFHYNINRNKLLLLLNALPKRMQFWVIRLILKK